MALHSNAKTRSTTILLKILLIICILFTTLRNFSLHSITGRTLIELDQERKMTFVMNGSSAVDGDDDANRGAHINIAVKLSNSNNSIFRSRAHSAPSSSKQYEPAVVPFNFSMLPLALQPITTTSSCCPVLNRPPKKPKCGEICHTPHACNNTLYPYSSYDEKEFLKPMSTESKEGLRIRCNTRNGELHPPYQWCQQWLSDSIMHSNQKKQQHTSVQSQRNRISKRARERQQQTKHYEIDPYQAKLPPPGCSIFNNGGGSGSFQHVILFPGVKMAFCGIPKVGITQWLQFLRFTFGAKDYLSSPHIKAEAFAMRFDKMNEEAQMHILNDPEWKFIAFLRNPAERLLSAYLDKVYSKKLEREHFQKQHGLNRTLSFDEFLKVLAEQPLSCPSRVGNDLDRLKGVNWCTNPHWRPQTYSCGLSEFLPRFSFVGSLNHIHTQVKTILDELGLWETYGKWYHWHKRKEEAGTSRCNSPPPVVKAGETLFGFQQKPPKEGGSKNESSLRASDTGYGHATDSRSKMDKYYTPEMLEKVKRLYEHDYELWELVDEEGLHSGEELAVSLSDDCRASAQSKTNS